MKIAICVALWLGFTWAKIDFVKTKNDEKYFHSSNYPSVIRQRLTRAQISNYAPDNALSWVEKYYDRSYARPQPYSFGYEVNDAYNDYGHQQESDGSVTTGSYRVLLPDGRTQIVHFRADKNGYVADVKYQVSIYKPAAAAAIYKKAPSYKAPPAPSSSPTWTAFTSFSSKPAKKKIPSYKADLIAAFGFKSKETSSYKNKVPEMIQPVTLPPYASPTYVIAQPFEEENPTTPTDYQKEPEQSYKDPIPATTQLYESKDPDPRAWTAFKVAEAPIYEAKAVYETISEAPEALAVYETPTTQDYSASISSLPSDYRLSSPKPTQDIRISPIYRDVSNDEVSTPTTPSYQVSPSTRAYSRDPVYVAPVDEETARSSQYNKPPPGWTAATSAPIYGTTVYGSAPDGPSVWITADKVPEVPVSYESSTASKPETTTVKMITASSSPAYTRSRVPWTAAFRQPSSAIQPFDAEYVAPTTYRPPIAYSRVRPSSSSTSIHNKTFSSSSSSSSADRTPFRSPSIHRGAAIAAPVSFQYRYPTPLIFRTRQP